VITVRYVTCVVQHARLKTVKGVILEIPASASSAMTATLAIDNMSAKVLFYLFNLFISLLLHRITGLTFYYFQLKMTECLNFAEFCIFIFIHHICSVINTEKL